MTRAKKKRSIHQTVVQLQKDLRLAYQAAGKELSEENIKERMEEVLDLVMPAYMQKELCNACGITGALSTEDTTSSGESEEET